MKKILIGLVMLCIIPTIVLCTNENVEVDNILGEELITDIITNETVNKDGNEITNEIGNIEESLISTLSQEESSNFIYILFAVVAVSMIFENALKYLRDKIDQINDNKELKAKNRKTMFIILGIYLLSLVILFIISSLALKFDNQITWSLIFVSFCVVILSTFVRFKIFKKRK